jgi:hypothetical protein
MDISRLPDDVIRMVSEFATNKNMIKFATPAEQRKALWEHRVEEFAKKWAARRIAKRYPTFTPSSNLLEILKRRSIIHHRSPRRNDFVLPGTYNAFQLNRTNTLQLRK